MIKYIHHPKKRVLNQSKPVHNIQKYNFALYWYQINESQSLNVNHLADEINMYLCQILGGAQLSGQTLLVI